MPSQISHLSPNQYRSIDPYITRIKQYDTVDSQIYISESINQLLNMYGTDFVIKGFYPLYTDYSDNKFEIILCGGIFIQNNVLIHIRENINLILDVSQYDLENGYLIIHPNYAYLDTPVDNSVRIMIQYVSKNGKHVLPNGWTLDRDRLYFDIYEFDKHINQFKQSKISYMQIKHKVYYYRGFDNNCLKSLDYTVNKHYQSYNIKHIDMQSKVPPLQLGSVKENTYNSLLLYNRNIINSNETQYMFDSRYFGSDIIISHVDDSTQLYDIYNFAGNIVLKEISTSPVETKRSTIRDLSLIYEHNRKLYNVKSHNGNIILEEVENLQQDG